MFKELVGHLVEVQDVNGNIYRGTLIAIQDENLNVTLKEVDISGKEKAPFLQTTGCYRIQRSSRGCFVTALTYNSAIYMSIKYVAKHCRTILYQ